MSKRIVIAVIVGSALVAGAVGGVIGIPSAAAATRTMTVYKSPQCGCCTAWIKHLERNGFDVEIRNEARMAVVKRQYGVPSELTSCHTGIVDGLVVEGHVPADLIDRMLTDRGDAQGIGVPGMPIGSPGMEQGTPQPYTVYAFSDSPAVWEYATR